MKSSSGTELLDAAGIKFVATELLKRSSVITPNIPEAEILTGLTIKEVTDMEAAARKIFEMGARAVIVKGGHMERATDVLFDGAELISLAGEKANEDHLHGTGCTFASALTAQLAAGRGLLEAATLSKVYVTKAIEKAIPLKGRLRWTISSVRGSSRPSRYSLSPPAACIPPQNLPPTENAYVSRRFVSYFLWTMWPPTIVAIGAPLNVRPSNGELRDLLADSFTL
jgi:hypothetical protein